MSTDHFCQQSETPQPEEYVALRSASGLSERSLDAARMGLPHTLFATTIRDDRELIAMGRVVGDGGCNYEVVDIAVHPDYQRRGLGVRIMTAIKAYLDQHAPDTAYVSLIADDHAPALYAKFGFKPTAPASIGMAYRVIK